ncbi:MAG: FadR family transcriptional regulator [Actinobacteria bacterium]|nr:FadR family transcriptional regulator [Actinomycetota bacterium]
MGVARQEPLSVSPVKKAYEQVADQLRELIGSGDLAPAARLPKESALAHEFGVSRATIREALRVLSTQNLIRTTKGAGGGSYVTLPTVDHISQFLQANIGLLSQSSDVSLEDFLEARALVEVPAARLAAQRRSEADLRALHDAIPDKPLSLPTPAQFDHNKLFHVAVVQATGNQLLSIASQPLFSVLQTNLQRSTLGRKFQESINEHHRALAAYIASSDAVGAEEQMREHLDYLRPIYERAWKHRRTAR